jgi:pyruvate formate lyase activating enzyme
VAAVVFTQGCNFRCAFCHNPSLLPERVDEARLITEREVLDQLHRRRSRISAVVVSGGEPTLHPDLPVFLRTVRQMGFAVKLDTNGNRPEVLSELIGDGLVDFVAMDVKAFWPKYAKVAVVPVAKNRIAESMRTIAGSGLPHEFRTTIVPEVLLKGDIAAIRAMIPPGSRHKMQAYRDRAAGCISAGAVQLAWDTPGVHSEAALELNRRF